MFEDLVDVYKEQANVVADAGADLFVVETMMSLQECRAAVIAIREVCDLPIMVSLTYNPDGRTLYGTDPATATVVLQSLGADAIGINCSTGPEDMIEPVEKMAEYATIPILAKPNAGLPELENGVTVYKTGPEEFASCGKKLVEAGASIIGGCCGTTPEHIRALKEAVKDMPVHKPLTQKRRILTSERKLVEITLDGNFMVIGERINPTGKKKLQAELREGSLNMVRQMALDQEENGAAILDVNMGMNGIDEKEMMINTIYEVTSTVDCPLCIDSSHVDIIEAALRIYPGRALINSISMEKEKMDKLRVADAITEIFALFKRCNKYIDETMPWALAKDETKQDRLAEVLYNLVESITIGANLLTSFMPETSERILAQLYPENAKDGVRDFDDLDKFGLRASGIKVTDKPEILFARLDLEEVLKKAEEIQAAQKAAAGGVQYPQVEEKPEITIDDFDKIQIRVGEVLKCEPVPKAKKLLVSQIRIGDEVRQIVSGIAKYYKPEEMVGKKVAVITNLKPCKLCGVESQGMILAAADDADNLSVLTVDKDMIAGSEIR